MTDPRGVRVTILSPVFCVSMALGLNVAAHADEPRFEKLDNGLRVCIVEDHALPLVNVQLWFKVGSSYDPPDKPGLTHVAQTLLAERGGLPDSSVLGTDSRTLSDACFIFSALALPAHADGQPDALAAVLRQMSQRLQSHAVSPAELGQALATAAAEAGDAGAIVEKSASRQLRAALFPSHPYQHPPEFVAESLRTLSADALREHIDRWFGPGNATLFVCGDVTFDRTMPLVREQLGTIAWRDTPRRAEFDPPPDEQISKRTPAAAGHAGAVALSIAWLTPPKDSPEEAAINVLMNRLCNSVDGPLAKRLRDAGFASIRWRHETFRVCGMLTMTIARTRAGSQPSKDDGDGAGDIERIVTAELDRAATAVPTEVELNRARALAARQVLEQRAAPLERVRRLAEHEIIGGDALLADYELPRTRRVYAGELMLAAQYLMQSRRVVLATGARPTAGPDAVLLASLEMPGSASRPFAPFDAQLLTRVDDPKNAAIRTALAARSSRRNIGDRVRLTVSRFPGVEIASVRVAQAGPNALEPITAGGVEAIRRHLASEAIADYATYHGFEFSASAEGVSASGPTDRLESLVEAAIDAYRKGGAAADATMQLDVTADVDPDRLDSFLREQLGFGGE